MCESCVGAARLCRALCLWFGYGVAWLCVLFIMRYLLYAIWGILFGCLVVFGCGWFEWLSAVRAVEILSPMSSLGYLDGDAQLVFLFGVGSNGTMLFDLGRSFPHCFPWVLCGGDGASW